MLIFGSVFPFVIAIAIFAFMLESRIDSFKLMRFCRRPHVNPENDIGVWSYILEILSKVAVVTNIGLLIFTSRFTQIFAEKGQTDIPLYWKVWLFVILENGFLIIKTALSAGISDVSTPIQRQRQRHEHLKMLMTKQKKQKKEKPVDDDYNNKVVMNE